GGAALGAAVLIVGLSILLPQHEPSSTSPAGNATNAPTDTAAPSPTTTSSTPPAPISVCASGQLSAKWSALWPAAGSETNWITITNTGNAACSLPTTKPTQLVGISSSGTQKTLQPELVPADTFGLSPVTQLQPGQPVGFTVTVGDPSMCSSGGSAQSYTQL